MDLLQRWRRAWRCPGVVGEDAEGISAAGHLAVTAGAPPSPNSPPGGRRRRGRWLSVDRAPAGYRRRRCRRRRPSRRSSRRPEVLGGLREGVALAVRSTREMNVDPGRSVSMASAMASRPSRCSTEGFRQAADMPRRARRAPAPLILRASGAGEAERLRADGDMERRGEHRVERQVEAPDVLGGYRSRRRAGALSVGRRTGPVRSPRVVVDDDVNGRPRRHVLFPAGTEPVDEREERPLGPVDDDVGVEGDEGSTSRRN